ncbi:MAG: dTDP-4-dehydrorhamnose reductase [Sphingomonadales bacterium]|jgi:dTDP-4-dehydrorhamnose reductase|nr:dTDP-4-dehydrorhamnose reductase [Sphingomonadales bacterium]
MRLLITGREGQLARCLAEIGAADRSLTVQTLARPELDLGRIETIRPAIRSAAPDVILNAAAYTAVDQAEDEPEIAFRVNAEAAGELAAAAREAGAPIIHISTDYVFDGRGEGPYPETAATNPLGVYGRSKLAGEREVAAANPDHLIVRTAWVYSPFGRNFVKTMLNLARERDRLSVVDDQWGNPSSALDLAEGLLSILRRWRDRPGHGFGEIYHLAGSGSTSWCRFAAAILDCSSRLGGPTAEVQPIATRDWPTKAPRPANSRLDCSKFAGDFGYVAPEWTLSTAETVRRLVAGVG